MVIENLSKACSDASACLSYAYCDSRNETTSDSQEIKSSLLKQIRAEGFDIPEAVLAKYGTMRRTDAGRLTESEIDDLLIISAQGFSTIAIVVDALDECTMPASLCTTLNKLSSSSVPPLVKVFVTTRPDYRDTDNYLGDSPVVSASSRCTHSDISTYVSDSVRGFILERRLILHDPALSDEIITTLIEKADSM